MQVTIHPSIVKGTIRSAASKSSMQRACAAALLQKGTTQIINPGISNDDLAAIDVIQHLGATINYEKNGDLIINSNGIMPISNELNCGESGLGIRMFAPLAALSNQQLTVNGTGSLLSRPMNFFDDIFPQLGVTIESNNGKLPITITGPLNPVDIEIDGSLSSQFLTGLLMAYGAAGADGVHISVKNLKSKPYIDLTIQVMNHFGYEVTNHNYEIFSFKDSKQKNINALYKYQVEGDWSGAAFLLVAGAIAGNVVVEGLDVLSTQADKAILKALIDCGCILSIGDNRIEVGNSILKSFHFNATDCPDLFPPLVALAACCEGTTVIEGVKRLEHKESNRGITLQEEFAKLGVEIKLQDDLMLIKGFAVPTIKSTTVHSRHDHRIAMACAVAALKAEGPVVIDDADAINKSYPNFYLHLQKLGVIVV
jgi:3-phosphoshikimate 1-carboxyvinyltransferase